MKTKSLLILLILMNIILACKKDDVQTHSSTDTRFAVENGYVHFKDMSSFKSVMTELHGMKSSELPKWQSDHNIINSMRSTQEQDTTKNVDTFIVPDMCFASVVNSSGVFAIGDTIHKLTLQTEYLIPIKDVNGKVSIESMMSNVNCKKYSITRGIKSLLKFTGDPTPVWVYYNASQINITPSDNLETRRVKAYSWVHNTLAYNSIGLGLYSMVRKKNFWGTKYWKDSPMASVSVRGQTSYKRSVVYPEDFSAYNSSNDANVYDEQCTLAWSIGELLNAYWIVGNYTFRTNGFPEYSIYNVQWQ